MKKNNIKIHNVTVLLHRFLLGESFKKQPPSQSCPGAEIQGVDTITGTLAQFNAIQHNSPAAQTISEKISAFVDTVGGKSVRL